MKLARIYVWNQKLIIPRVMETAEGLFVDEGPVLVLPIESFEDWRPAIVHTLYRENEYKEHEHDRDHATEAAEVNSPGSAILETLKIKKWSTFEQQAIMYTLHFGGRYIHLYRTGKGLNGMWTKDQIDERQFDPRAPLCIVADVLLSDIKKQPEFRPPATGLMLLPKAEQQVEGNLT